MRYGGLNLLFAGLSCASAVLLAGCYTYVPTGLENVTSGGSVRIQLTAAGMAHVHHPAGAPPTSLTGDVSEVSGGSVLLMLEDRSAGPVYRRSPVREIRLRPSDIHEVEARTLNRRRTSLVATGLAALIGLSFYLVHVHDPGGGSQGPGGGIDFQRIPLIP